VRGYRGEHDAPVSLFAFQDIMTAVIGIFLLVVLLMCLQLRTVTARASQIDEQLATALQLENELSAARAEERVADARIERAQKQLRRQRRSDRQIEYVVARRRELSGLYVRIAEVEKQLQMTFEELRALTEGGTARQRLEETTQLEEKKKRLQAELDAVRRHHGLTYLLNQRFSKTPLLVVTSGDKVRMGIVGSERGAITFAHPSAETRAEAIVQWLQQFAPRRYYVLLVLKPSAPPEWVVSLRRRLTELGFAQGLDLLPEDWTVLQYSALVTGQTP